MKSVLFAAFALVALGSFGCSSLTQPQEITITAEPIGAPEPAPAPAPPPAAPGGAPAASPGGG